MLKDPGRYKLCDRCHPLPLGSLWRKEGAKPLGGPPFLNARSWRSFGVELEGFQRPVEMPSNWDKPVGWVVGSDGSIVPPHGERTAEWKSPPLFGDQGLKKLTADVAHLRKAGWDANKSCGLHVHLDASGLDEADHRAVFRFAKWHEDEVFTLLPPSRRDNRYCKRLSGRISKRDRYVWANFCALTEFGTIEIRAAAGSFHPIRVRQWVALMLTFFEAAIRFGRMRAKPRGSLLELLKLPPRDVVYWTARRNRFAKRLAPTTAPASAGA